jgi:hypothetical protein
MVLLTLWPFTGACPTPMCSVAGVIGARTRALEHLIQSAAHYVALEAAREVIKAESYGE